MNSPHSGIKHTRTLGKNLVKQNGGKKPIYSILSVFFFRCWYSVFFHHRISLLSTRLFLEILHVHFSNSLDVFMISNNGWLRTNPNLTQTRHYLFCLFVCLFFFYHQSRLNNLSLQLDDTSRVGPRGRGREWATLGEHPLTWLLSNNRLEKVPFVSVLHTSSNRLLLSNQKQRMYP